MQASDLYLNEHREYGLSTYSCHSDGSGVCFSSRLRPILNMRPKYRHWLSPSLRQLNADLHLTDWLEAKGIDYDVHTDEDLDREGVDLLNRYPVVLTGSHPEYSSENMLTAYEAYQQAGGRWLYLGADGFYWVSQYHPDDSNIIEVRKGDSVDVLENNLFAQTQLEQSFGINFTVLADGQPKDCLLYTSPSPRDS